MSSFIPSGMGWLRDLPDPRDYASDDEKVRTLLQSLKSAPELPESVDLRLDDSDQVQYFSPVEDQGELNCSAAHAALALLEYFERRSHGQTFEGSALFLYKVTRKLQRTGGNCGAGLRSTFKAIRRFGVPPAELWHCDKSRFDDELEDVCLLGYARDFEDMSFVRLDAGTPASRETAGQKAREMPLLDRVKSFLAAGFPVAFGFSVPRSMTIDANIPFRPELDSIRGGQVVVAVGYDDRRATSPPGALQIRSSWGEDWGQSGYGWLPYAHVERQNAADFWTVLRPDWLASGEYRLPTIFSRSLPQRRKPAV